MTDGAFTDGRQDSSDQAEADVWETWEKGASQFVTVREGGGIAPNATTMETHLSEAVGVVMKARRDSDVIGLRPVPAAEFDGDDPKHYSLNRGSDGGSASVSARAFLREQGLDHDETRRYTPAWNDRFGLLTVDLGAEGEPLSSED